MSEAGSTNDQRAKRLGTSASRGERIAVTVDGEPTMAFDGESIATLLLAAGYRGVRLAGDGSWRAPYCNMGVCFECVVMVDSRAGVRACMTPARDGMSIERRVDAHVHR